MSTVKRRSSLKNSDKSKISSKGNHVKRSSTKSKRTSSKSPGRRSRGSGDRSNSEKRSSRRSSSKAPSSAVSTSRRLKKINNSTSNTVGSRVRSLKKPAFNSLNSNSSDCLTRRIRKNSRKNSLDKDYQASPLSRVKSLRRLSCDDLRSTRLQRRSRTSPTPQRHLRSITPSKHQRRKSKTPEVRSRRLLKKKVNSKESGSFDFDRTSSTASKVLPLLCQAFSIPWWFSRIDMEEVTSILSPFLKTISVTHVNVIVCYCKKIPNIDELLTNIGIQEEATITDKKITVQKANALGYFLSINSVLIELSLMNNNIGDKVITRLTDGLKKNSTITMLNLSYNNIGDVGARKLAETLAINTVLKSLDLRNNPNISIIGSKVLSNSVIKSESITSFGEIYLPDITDSEPPITQLLLCNMRCGDIEVLVILSLLKKNTSVTKLDLSCNYLGDPSAQRLSHALKSNTTLKILDIRKNPGISIFGSKMFTNAILKNKTIRNFSGIFVRNLKTNKSSYEEIHLNNTGCGNTEALVISALLKDNSILSDLNMCYNNVGDEGAQALAKTLLKNKTITSLNLGNNVITDIGMQSISNALKKNSTLLELELYSNKITDAGVETLAEAMKENSVLQLLFVDKNKYTKKGEKMLQNARKDHPSISLFMC